MEETLTAVPRFVFIHRILVTHIPPDHVQDYMATAKEKMSYKNKMPAIEYFIAVRTGQDYELTILDLSTMSILKG
jgi:hypothetical protein